MARIGYARVSTADQTLDLTIPSIILFQADEVLK